MKRAEKKGETTRELMGIKSIEENSIVTENGELVFYIIKPSNISVLPEGTISARINALMNVLKGSAEIEIIAMSSKENFEDCKASLKRRLEKERNPIIANLIREDSLLLDRMQIKMSTARQFLIVIRLRNEREKDVRAYLARIEKSLEEQGFVTKMANAEDIKMLLGIYYEQNVTTDKFEDFDGERWVIV